MRLYCITVVAGLVAVAAAARANGNGHVVHEKREMGQRALPVKRRAPPDLLAPVRIGMSQSNLHVAEDLLMEVSDPQSPNYGKHYTQNEVHDLFAPSEDTIKALREWLEQSGIDKSRVTVSFNRQWLQFDAPIAELEALIKADFHLHEDQNGDLHLGCSLYHVPEHVRHHIDYITPGVNFVQLTKRQNTSKQLKKRKKDWTMKKSPLGRKPLPKPLDYYKKAGDSTCGDVVFPNCISHLYNITKGTSSRKGNEIGLFEDLASYYSKQDLTNFFKSAAPQIPPRTRPIPKLIDGAKASTKTYLAGGEVTLDLQVAYPIVWPQQVVLFTTDDPPTSADYNYYGFINNFLYGIDGSYCHAPGNNSGDPPYPDPKKGGYHHKLQCGAYKPTNVISISYVAVEYAVSVSYWQRQCKEYLKLAMQGITTVVASGDYGVGGNPFFGNSSGCIPSKHAKFGLAFEPSFPASCPWVTTVGATTLPPGSKDTYAGEIATTEFSSGGGFSNIFSTPAYQKKHVETYLDKYSPKYHSYAVKNAGLKEVEKQHGLFNRAGRAFPDVAALGQNILIYWQGFPQLVYGTSAATPIFAGILTRINEKRLAAGKSTVGFVNKILYDHPELLHDITKGQNPACSELGFTCSPGWDPVTGLGTPDYDKMLKFFMALP